MCDLSYSDASILTLMGQLRPSDEAMIKQLLGQLSKEKQSLGKAIYAQIQGKTARNRMPQQPWNQALQLREGLRSLTVTEDEDAALLV